MKWGLQTHWDDRRESIDEWLERERHSVEKVENPTCPYCNSICREWWEVRALNEYEVTDYQMECDRCEKTYLLSKATQIRFESKKLDVK